MDIDADDMSKPSACRRQHSASSMSYLQRHFAFGMCQIASDWLRNMEHEVPTASDKRFVFVFGVIKPPEKLILALRGRFVYFFSKTDHMAAVFSVVPIPIRI